MLKRITNVLFHNIVIKECYGWTVHIHQSIWPLGNLGGNNHNETILVTGPFPTRAIARKIKLTLDRTLTDICLLTTKE